MNWWFFIFFSEVHNWLNIVKILWTSKKVHLWHSVAISNQIVSPYYSTWGTCISQNKKLPPFLSFKSFPISLQLSLSPPNCRNFNILREEWIILAIKKKNQFSNPIRHGKLWIKPFSLTNLLKLDKVTKALAINFNAKQCTWPAFNYV